MLLLFKGGPIIDYIVHVVAGTVTSSVLVLIILAVCVCMMTVYKRKMMKSRSLLQSGNAFDNCK